jgi:prepilin-type N-terminal cleavage/methylation domain-containing protein
LKRASSRCWTLDTGYWMSVDRASSIKHRVSSIKHRASSIEHGFSLIEVTIVVVIILLMTSATVPWMRNFSEASKLRSAARSIRSLMEFARNSAITERTEYAVVIDLAQQEYWLSLLEYLEESSGGITAEAFRTSLSEESESTSDKVSTGTSGREEEEIEGAFSRTGGFLGVPRQLPNTIEILQVVSQRITKSNVEVDYVAFYPNGTAEDCEIYLQGRSGRVFLVSVTKSTGRTRIKELTTQEIEELGLDVGAAD